MIRHQIFEMLWKGLFIVSLIAFLFPTASHAKQIGIKFAEMKVGTVVYFVEANGAKTTATYVGQKRRGLAVRINAGWNNGKLLRWAYFDTSGRLIETVDSKRWKSKRFLPFSCLYAVGRCTHTERYRGGQHDVEFNNSLNGKNLTVRKRKTTEEKFEDDFHVVLGKYNLFQREGAPKGVPGKWFIKIVKIRSPE